MAKIIVLIDEVRNHDSSPFIFWLHHFASLSLLLLSCSASSQLGSAGSENIVIISIVNQEEVFSTMSLCESRRKADISSLGVTICC